MKKPILFLTLILTLILTSCKSSSSDPKKAMCDSLVALNTAIQGTKTITASSSLDQVKQSGQQLEDAWVNVQKTTKKIKEPALSDVRDSYKEIVKSLRSAVDATTLQQAVTTIQGSTPKFDAAYTKISSTDCTNK